MVPWNLSSTWAFLEDRNLSCGHSTILESTTPASKRKSQNPEANPASCQCKPLEAQWTASSSASSSTPKRITLAKQNLFKQNLVISNIRDLSFIVLRPLPWTLNGDGSAKCYDSMMLWCVQTVLLKLKRSLPWGIRCKAQNFG